MPGVEERETKLSVPLGFVMPPIELEGVTVDDHGDEVLNAVYWDTDGLVLANASVGVRHRNGTWTFKGPSRQEGDATVREELEVDADPNRLPRTIEERLGDMVDLAQLRPVARIRTVRGTREVSGDGSRAELVHDRVTVLDGERQVATFEEVEVEHPADSRGLAERLVALIVAAGGAVDPTAKYVRALRALGHRPPTTEM